MYDYLIVGSGIFGATFANRVTTKGKKCLVIERRNNVGGNVYTKSLEGINIHCYGAHIFHTDDKGVWDYINEFAEFNNYINSPIANYKGEIYNLPFNMNTFSRILGVSSPAEAQSRIIEERKEIRRDPSNLEEQAIKLVGRSIYEKLIKGYTEKQWGKDCKDLPASIINRIPVRFIYDNNYFDDRYQGIPIGGYTQIIEKMLCNCDVELGVDYLCEKEKYEKLANKVIFTGPIDEFYNYRLGVLEYRSLLFETTVLDTENYQGVAVMNYTDVETPYTRIIEHKHFEFGQQKKTVITKEIPKAWQIGDEPYYPINDQRNISLYNEYSKIANYEKNVIFGGRLGEYKYYDMHVAIKLALDLAKKELA